jgi:hypothetical protein
VLFWVFQFLPESSVRKGFQYILNPEDPRGPHGRLRSKCS